MWTAGYKYSWKKMEATAQNRAEDGEEWSVAAYVPPGSAKLRSSCLAMKVIAMKTNYTTNCAPCWKTFGICDDTFVQLP